MKNTCTFTTMKILINTILLGTVASFSHFAYTLSGNNVIVGLFNPVNESVWEHLKFMFFPFLLWWITVYFIKSKECDIPSNTWLVSAAVSLVVAPLSVILLLYGYEGAFGKESVLVDILLVFVCYFIALCMASHFLKYSEPSTWAAILSVSVIVVIFVAFIVFTVNPPQLPLFYDTTTKTYGIN